MLEKFGEDTQPVNLKFVGIILNYDGAVGLKIFHGRLLFGEIDDIHDSHGHGRQSRCSRGNGTHGRIIELTNELREHSLPFLCRINVRLRYLSLHKKQSF